MSASDGDPTADAADAARDARTAVEILAPANEEGTRARVLRWYKATGEAIRRDEPLLELETDKVTVEIPSPANGVLAEILKQPDEEVLPGEVLGRLHAAPRAAAAPPAPAAPAARMYAAQPQAQEARVEERAPLSPAVRKRLNERALAATEVRGSGQGGRITVRDVEQHVAGPSRLPHTPIRRRIAEHMARSLAQAPHVTTLFEADLTRVRAHRARHAAEFEGRGARLTLTAYFIAACAKALAAHPAVNATFHQDALELHPDVNIGVGTALGDEGLIVPVIHRVQALDLYGIAHRLGELVAAARAGRLAPEEVRGGTFTLSNHGVGGSLLAAPIIINQPQVAILGVGKVERRVSVQESQGIESIGIRSMCYLTLTIDHRALDAFQANAFLSHLVGTLEGWP